MWLFSPYSNSFEPLPDPLREHYFPLFLKNGPRSLVLKYLLEGRLDIDIRDPINKKIG